MTTDNENYTEDALSDTDRLSILSAVAESAKAKPKEVITKGKVDLTETFDEKTPFDVLLEKSLERREKMDEEDCTSSDEIRKKIIESSRLDLIGKFSWFK